MNYKSNKITNPLNSVDKSILDLIQILDEIPDAGSDEDGSWTITDEMGNEVTLSQSNGKVTITIGRKHWNLVMEVQDAKPIKTK